jgi:two-component system, NtrC family, sensor kinase
MTKKFLLIFLLTSCCQISIAQTKNNDSLKRILSFTSKPIERFDIMNKILEAQVGNVDSASAIELLQIAQEQKNDSLLAISYNWIGSYFAFNKGDNTSALEYYFKALPLAEKVKDKRRISSLYFDISLVYLTLQNFDYAVKNIRKGGENLPSASSPMYLFMLLQYQRNMSNYFLLTHQSDSALLYAQTALETCKKSKNVQFERSALTLIAAAYAQMGDEKMAQLYFNKSIAITAYDPVIAKQSFNKNYIPFLLQNKMFAKALVQSKADFQLGEENDNNNIKLIAVGFLRQVYDSLQETDSAYFYSRMELSLRDSVFNQNNINRIQSLAFNQQLSKIEDAGKKAAYESQLKQYALLAGLAIILIIALLLGVNNFNRKKANKLLQKQKEEIEVQKKNVEQTLSELKSTQAQLIQSEKMASLGELTAGIAHEIQNPLNFVNNFSDVNKELVDELQSELKSGNIDEVIAISNDIKENEEKINHHGKRADAIVKGMLQHSRQASGTMEPTDINALCDEYLRLSYHGLRAKDKSFNADIKTDFDESVGKINIIPQDIGRVLLNLFNNAFYAVNEQKNQNTISYNPTVFVHTQKCDDKIQISVRDNGNGIPQKILDKIFQPFFTTKPTGQGTGLGLSLSYDIIKAHGGELKVESEVGKGSEFVIQLPV